MSVFIPSRIAVQFLFYAVQGVFAFLTVAAPCHAYANDHTPLKSALEKVTKEYLAKDLQWRKILFYTTTWFTGQKSLVDDPNFFLSRQGKSDPSAELQATLKAFGEGTPDERQEALCQYPARRHWLEQKLELTFDDPSPNNDSDVCRRFKLFKKSVSSNKASLIFSSHYPGNPASLFGHTLLKFAKLNSNGKNSNELLDFGLNHAAHPTTANPLLYIAMGLTGFFPGYISLMPYYVKVQEYNNSESRDLWEYELNLTPEEVKMALWSVFELSTHRVNYYYFDDNCSLLMLAIIEIARPSVKLVEKFNAWVIPGDTVRVVFEQSKLVAQVKFRASNVRRYLTLEANLSEAERNAFNQIIESKKKNKFTLSVMDALNVEQKMKVIDTALEYIDAEEQLAGTKEPAKWKSERPILLENRAQLGVPSPIKTIETPSKEAPHEAYPPTRLTLGATAHRREDGSRQNGVLLGWRPALHTLNNPLAGMGADLGIAFFNLEYIIHEKKVWLREFTPLEIETIPVEKPHLSAKSWQFGLRYRQNCFAGCGQTTVNGGYGRAWSFIGDESRIAARGEVKAGDDENVGWFIEPGISAYINVPLQQNKRWITRISLSQTRSANLPPQWNHDFGSVFALRPFSPMEIEVSAKLLNRDLEFSIRNHWYF